jgi:hypothetical protein
VEPILHTKEKKERRKKSIDLGVSAYERGERAVVCSPGKPYGRHGEEDPNVPPYARGSFPRFLSPLGCAIHAAHSPKAHDIYATIRETHQGGY